MTTTRLVLSPLPWALSPCRMSWIDGRAFLFWFIPIRANRLAGVSIRILVLDQPKLGWRQVSSLKDSFVELLIFDNLEQFLSITEQFTAYGSLRVSAGT